MSLHRRALGCLGITAIALAFGCGGKHVDPLQPAETFSWCPQPITFSPPSSRWYREGDNGGGMLGIRFVLKGGGGQCISVLSYRLLADRYRKDKIARLITRRDSLYRREFLHELALVRPRTDDPISEREAATAKAVNEALDRAMTDYLADMPGSAATELETALRLASGYEMTLPELLPRIRLQPDKMQEPNRWRIGYERDTVVAGHPAFASDDTLITPERPLLYHEVFWVVKGYAFKAVYQGTPENVPTFHQVLGSVVFPELRD